MFYKKIKKIHVSMCYFMCENSFKENPFVFQCNMVKLCVNKMVDSLSAEVSLLSAGFSTSNVTQNIFKHLRKGL